jgi:hypothetical protein
MSELIWLLILMYCLSLQRFTHSKYSMKSELIFIIGINLILNVGEFIFIILQMDELSLFFGLCTSFPFYPVV